MESIIAALLIGFLGSFHCIGMCGPIAMSVGSYQTGSWWRIFSALVYNAGRIFTYSVFGALFGLFGKGFIIAGWQQGLSITLGVALLAGVIFGKRLNGGFSQVPFIYKFLAHVRSQFTDLFKSKKTISLFFIGLLNGLLPCGLVYLAVAGAIAAGGIFHGSLFMAMFGLGTLPAMLFVSFSSHFITPGVRTKIRRTVPVFVGIMACMLILRGMNLGVPYLSPALSKTDCTKHSCCQHK